MTPQALVGLLAEPARLRAFSAVVLGASSPSAVAEAAGLPPRETGAALRRLQEGGLVEYVDGAVRARTGHLKEMARQTAAAGASAAPAVDHGTGDAQLESLLRTFLHDSGDRIRTLPRQFGRRTVVLHHLTHQFFESGTAYPERDVNEILRRWCAGAEIDHVTVRRYLIDHGLLRREDGGAYWLPEERPATV